VPNGAGGHDVCGAHTTAITTANGLAALVLL